MLHGPDMSGMISGMLPNCRVNMSGPTRRDLISHSSSINSMVGIIAEGFVWSVLQQTDVMTSWSENRGKIRS